jgi:hypothetical protein
MTNKENTTNNSDKSIEELAREAMDAIKKSEIKTREKEERALLEEAQAKEAALKEEVAQKIKRKLRLLEKEEAKKPKEDEQDPRLMVNWSNSDKRGINYEGHYNDNYTFRIKKGLNLYHLYVEDKKLEIEAWQRSTCTSIDLFTLKVKADKILKEAIDRAAEIKRLEEIKKKSEGN